MKLNTVVSFIYDGGSNAGSVRRVFVTSIGEGYFGGYDFDRNSHRNFSFSKTLSESQIDGAYVLQLPEFLIDSTHERLIDEGFDCVVTQDGLLVACPHVVIDKYAIRAKGDQEGIFLDINHTDGQFIGVHFDSDGISVGREKVSFTQFVLKLVEFVGKTEGFDDRSDI